MARYTGPVCRICRRQGMKLYLKGQRCFGPKCAVERRKYPPGEHGQGRRKISEFGLQLAEKQKIPWVATNDPRYSDMSSRLVHDVLTALRYDTTIDRALEQGFLHPNGEWRLLSPAEMQERWKGREEGLDCAERIAAECDFDLSWLRPPLPKFPNPPGYSDIGFLREKAYEGARERWVRISRRRRRTRSSTSCA